MGGLIWRKLAAVEKEPWAKCVKRGGPRRGSSRGVGDRPPSAAGCAAF
jgi:hypothetical protein